MCRDKSGAASQTKFPECPNNIADSEILYQSAKSIYRVAQKSKPPPIFQKIALKIANEIRFLRKVKV